MSSVQAHYDQLLGPVYTWMAGGWNAALARNCALLDSLGLATWPRGTAVDLGCGSGFQTIPLADAGFDVLALDLCASLLAELRTRAGARSIHTVQGDLLNFPAHLTGNAALIVCMGDTLTHLPSVGAVAALIHCAAACLAPGGRLVLGFRDLATHELQGPQRFIPVRSEPVRIFTCFLDYRPDHVEVSDLIHTRNGDQWQLASSTYRKLRLTAAQVGALLTTAGLTLEHSSTEQGAVRLVALRS
ncbi:MAG: class I SAM-dependent methyltransferase [Verrucomicrobia bacterium]|nr:class I SAM-dependent methyltransferase [Verrucomicrobiota bacterium]